MLFHLDWLAFTVHGVGSSLLDADGDGFSMLVSQVINSICVGAVEGLTRRNLSNWRDVCVLERKAGRGYRQRWTLPGGVSVYADPVNEDQRHVHVEIKGQAASAAGASAFRALFRQLEGRYKGRWSVKRIDAAWDRVPFRPRDMREAIEAGNIRTRARRDRMGWHEEPLNASGPTSTCTLGSRASGFFLRVYDRRGPVRCELQMNDERADAFARVLVGLREKDWSVAGLGFLRDFADFIDAGSDSNSTRAGLLSWWSCFVDGAGRAWVVLSSGAVKSLDAIYKWFKSQVSATFAMLAHYAFHECGGDLEFLMRLVEIGKSRWRERHLAILEAAGVPV